jgi:hypothetical protein
MSMIIGWRPLPKAAMDKACAALDEIALDEVG